MFMRIFNPWKVSLRIETPSNQNCHAFVFSFKEEQRVGFKISVKICTKLH